MSQSADGSLLALGGVDGTITLWNTETLKILKKFPEVHELPVTCIAARPYSTPLQGDDEGIVMHALSASADSKFALLTLQRRGPKKPRGNKSSSGSVPVHLSCPQVHYHVDGTRVVGHVLCGIGNAAKMWRGMEGEGSMANLPSAYCTLS